MEESHVPHWGMVIDLAKCVGCDSCTVACKAENRTPPGISYNVVLEQETGTYPNVRIEALPRPCMQCENPACVSVCPVKATYRGEDGIVVIDADRCIGCKYCIAACPYNVRFINPQTRVAENCDFCLHTKLAKGEDPACVSKCRYGALAFGDLNDPNSYVAKLLDVKDAVRVRPYLGTEPSLRYIPVMKEKI